MSIDGDVLAYMIAVRYHVCCEMIRTDSESKDKEGQCAEFHMHTTRLRKWWGLSLLANG